MRRLTLAVCLAQSFAMTPMASHADTIQDLDWQLLAIDGQLVDPAIRTSLRIDAEGKIFGRAPCNSYGAQNSETLPAFKLGPIRATRALCGNMAEERVFLAALAVMEMAALDGTLILTGPDGRSMEFALDRTAGQTVCKTCMPTE